MLPQLSMSDNSVDSDSVESEGSGTQRDPDRDARIVDEKRKWQQNVQGAIKNLGLLEGTNYNDIHVATQIMYRGRQWAETDLRQIVWFLPLSQDDPIMSAIATLYLYSSRTTGYMDSYIELCFDNCETEEQLGDILVSATNMLIYLAAAVIRSKSNEHNEYLHINTKEGAILEFAEQAEQSTQSTQASKRKRDPDWIRHNEWIKISTTFENGNAENVTRDLANVKTVENGTKQTTWRSLSGSNVPWVHRMSLVEWDGDESVVRTAHNLIRQRYRRQKKAEMENNMVKAATERVLRVLQRALITAVAKKMKNKEEQWINNENNKKEEEEQRIVLPRAERWWVKYSYTRRNTRSIKIAKLDDSRKKAEKSEIKSKGDFCIK